MSSRSEEECNSMNLLECGTSLAELEHTTELYRDNEQLKDEVMNDVMEINQSFTKSNVTVKAGICSSVQQKIDTLRLSIKKDVVSNESVTMFTSPFETEMARKATGQTEIPEAERYASVPLIYCDQTASNRPLKSVESFINEHCLPLYGNTHTNTSVTGSQSTAFVAEARQIVAEGVNAKITGKAALDVVLFAGNGTTSAVELLIDCMGVKNSHVTLTERPVVFVGPYEHHSNLIPWRESGFEIVMIPECVETQDVDAKYLQTMLMLPKFKNRLKMGTFSAASNVTGKICDVNKIAAILHQHNALAFFDYATGAPYLPMDMNPPPTGNYSSADIAKDAIFLSPHKMIGGINTPGILIVKKNLVNQTNAPGRSGGGTVFYVTHTHHRFLSNRIERYEGGTPNVVGIMRVGLTFLVKRKLESCYITSIKSDDGGEHHDGLVPQSILEYDNRTHRHVVDTLNRIAPNIIFLGEKSHNVNVQHLPIFSFLIKCGRRYLHCNYVSAILNDLFGIQSRSGCQCAGPYSQHLLGLTKNVDGEEVPNEANKAIENALIHYKERAELLRPGYTRLSLPFKGLCSEEVEYVIKALDWVSKHAWALMCQYRCNHRTGEWRHFSRQGKPLGRTERRWLSHYEVGNVERLIKNKGGDDLKLALENALKNADYQLKVARNEHRYMMQALKMSDDNQILDGDEELERLRWYVYPKECAKMLKGGLSVVPDTYSNEVLGAIKPNKSVKIVPQLNFEATYETETKMISSTLNSDENERYPFRDGDYHSGEASLKELDDGFNDGELSSKCLIFTSKDDDWIPIEKFLNNKRKGTKISDDEAVYEVSNKPTIMARINDTSIHLGDATREKKKPSRASSQWGETTTIVEPFKASTKKTDELNFNEHLNLQNGSKKRKLKNGNHIIPPPKLMKYIIQAIMQFEMIQDGDRLLLGLSGGKDSLTLLHCLLELKRKLPTKFEIEVCTIDPMTPSFDPSPLIAYVESLGLTYHYVKDNIVERANNGGKNGSVVTSLCAYCARMKRGNLYTVARKNNCNKLVLAQHLDDCAESCLMSMMHNGFIRTMKSKYEINAGDITVIRPLVYCRESLMTDFAKQNNLPVINENCPACFEEPKERARVKKLLSREETLYPNIYDNLRRSLIPIMHDDMTAILKCYTEEAVSKSRKDKGSSGKNKRNAYNYEQPNLESNDTIATSDEMTRAGRLSSYSDDELLKEMTRRKSYAFKMAGAMKRLGNGDKSIVKSTCDEPSK